MLPAVLVLASCGHADLTGMARHYHKYCPCMCCWSAVPVDGEGAPPRERPVPIMAVVLQVDGVMSTFSW